MAKEKKLGRIQRVRNALSRWFEWDLHVGIWRFIGDSCKRYFVVRHEDTKQSFQNVVDKLGLTEEGLHKQANSFWRLAIFNLFLLFLMLSYAIYMALNRKYPGACAALGVCGLPLGLAVHYHFWYFQVTERRLGCRLREWFKKGILGRS